MRRLSIMSVIALAGLAVAPLAASASGKTIDPNGAIDGDINRTPAPAPQSTTPYRSEPVDPGSQDYATPAPSDNGYPVANQAPRPADRAQGQDNAPYSAPAQNGQYAAPGGEAQRNAVTESADTYDRNDLMSAAEGVFGKGAEGLAGIIEKILKDQGRPNAYIAGREASGAFVVGLRYGSGVLNSKIEGQQPVYWTGPSVGFDAGADASKVFVLVYNLNDTEKLFRRYPAAEGNAYAVGGFTASYLRRGDIVLIPIRLGVGLRLGANVGYMKFSQKSDWVPF